MRFTVINEIFISEPAKKSSLQTNNSKIGLEDTTIAVSFWFNHKVSK